MGNYLNTGNAGFAAVLASGIGDADVVFIPKKHSNGIRRRNDSGWFYYDVKSKKHTCRIKKLER